MRNRRFIYFAGVDGCGKTTVIDELIKEYNSKGIKAKCVWLRFNYFITRPVLLFCRIIGITRREEKGGKIFSIHDFHRSKTIAFIVQYLHFLDTVIAYILKVWIPLTFTDCIILCDKFVFDIIADFMVETKDLGLLNRKIARLFLALIPSDTPVLFLSADKNEIIKRKPEVLIDDEDYDFKYSVYQMIMDKYDCIKINNLSLADTLSEVRNVLNKHLIQ